MGAGNGIRLASLPAVLLLTPWGTFTRELVRLALEHSGRTSARAGNRVAGGGSAVTLQRDAAEVHACRRAARAYRREPGHGRARQPAEHRSSQCEAPLIAPAVAGASPCDGAIRLTYRYPLTRVVDRRFDRCLATRTKTAQLKQSLIVSSALAP